MPPYSVNYKGKMKSKQTRKQQPDLQAEAGRVQAAPGPHPPAGVLTDHAAVVLICAIAAV